MTTPASGRITIHEETLRTTLASLPAFQTWTGTADSAAAQTHVYVGDVPPPSGSETYDPADLVALRPFAIVYTEPQAGYRASKDAVGTSWHFRESGRLVVMLEQEIPAAIRHDAAEVRRQFMNAMGQILDELLGQAGVAGQLAVRSATVYGPYRVDDDDIQGQGEPIVAYFDLEWGTA